MRDSIAQGLAASAKNARFTTLERVQKKLRTAPLALPAVMASPPTFTQQATGSTSAIPSSVFIPITDVRLGAWSQANWSVIQTGTLSDGISRPYYAAGGPTSSSGPVPMVMSLRTDAPQIDVVLGGSQFVQVIVDGQAAFSPPKNPTVAGGSRYVSSIIFGAFSATKPATRDITIICWGGTGCAGVFLSAYDSLSPGSRAMSAGGNQIAVAVQGDSYAPTIGSIAQLAMQTTLALGGSGFYLDCIGGTGYLQTNLGVTPTANNYLNRATPAASAYSTLATWNVDLDIILGGINDSAAITSAQVLAVLQAHRALYPNAVIAISGNFNPDPGGVRTTPGKQTAVQAAINAAALQLTGPWALVDNINGIWSNSVGASGSLGGIGFQTGDGRTLTFTAAPSAATSGTLTAVWQGATSTNWYITWADGSYSRATLTNGSTAVTWTGAVTQPANASVGTVAGNGHRYVGPDGTHPGQDGADYLSMRLADGISKAVLAL